MQPVLSQKLSRLRQDDLAFLLGKGGYYANQRIAVFQIIP